MKNQMTCSVCERPCTEQDSSEVAPINRSGDAPNLVRTVCGDCLLRDEEEVQS